LDNYYNNEKTFVVPILKKKRTNKYVKKSGNTMIKRNKK